MPMYICAVPTGAVSQEQKQPIAQALTRIHCDLTDAPPTFVHVFFMENEALEEVQITGNIRAGRTPELVAQLVQEMRDSVAGALSMPVERVSMTTREVPASWVMEGGDLLPEPGEEAEWLAMHEEKMQSL